MLADAAKDRVLPNIVDPVTVRRQLEVMEAEGDMFEMLDDAERAWRTAMGDANLDGGC